MTNEELVQLANRYRETAEPPTPYLQYEDDYDGPYLWVPYDLPDGVYAEIDGETYGTLMGFRIYLFTRDELTGE